MGVQDRDWYREEVRKRERAASARTRSVFRSPARGDFWGNVLRFIVICLAVYGALALVRDIWRGTVIDKTTFKEFQPKPAKPF